MIFIVGANRDELVRILDWQRDIGLARGNRGRLRNAAASAGGGVVLKRRERNRPVHQHALDVAIEPSKTRRRGRGERPIRAGRADRRNLHGANPQRGEGKSRRGCHRHIIASGMWEQFHSSAA